MPLLSVKELSEELSVSQKLIEELIYKKVITPYGGRARLGEPQFSRSTLSSIRKTIECYSAKC